MLLYKDILPRTEARLNSLRTVSDPEAHNFLTAAEINDRVTELLKNVGHLVTIASNINGKVFVDPARYRDDLFVLGPLGRSLMVKLTELSQVLPSTPTEGPAILVKERKMMDLMIDEWTRITDELYAVSRENKLLVLKTEMDRSNGDVRLWDRL